MSEHQMPGAGQDGAQAAPALELLKLRGAISDLALDEGRLKIQESQLQVWINRYQSEAQDTQDEARASKAREQLAILHPQLASVQEQLTRIQAQKAALTEQQQAILAKLNIASIDQARTITSADSGVAWSPAPPANLPKSPQRRRPSGRPAFWISGLLIMLVVSVVAFTILHMSSPPAPLSTGIMPTATATPTPEPPVFTANGTGPTDQNCQFTIGFHCYSPEQVQQAFSLTPLYRKGIDGRGQTIVILGAGYTTTLKADLAHFDQVWGLPDPDFQILQPHGPPAKYICPGNEDNLQLENTLDVEWSHAMAPGARIILIIGDNGGGSPEENCGNGSLPEDVNYALNHHLGNIISISYGGSELGNVSETARQHAEDKDYYQNADAIFRRAAEQHVTVLTSAGDEGATNENDFTKPGSYWNRPNIEWPASDPYVLAVGGTSLTIADATGTYESESVWNDPNHAATGGGLSSIFAEPGYQKQVPNQHMFQGKRGIPDVAFPAEDFILYASATAGILGRVDSQLNHWDLAGGTSLSAPCWAGLIALANQMYHKPLGFIQPALYWMHGEGMHDITSGGNSFAGVTGYEAQPGFDLASGWGTPIADEFIPALIQATLEISPGCKHAQHLCAWQPHTT